MSSDAGRELLASLGGLDSATKIFTVAPTKPCDRPSDPLQVALPHASFAH